MFLISIAYASVSWAQHFLNSLVSLRLAPMPPPFSRERPSAPSVLFASAAASALHVHVSTARRFGSPVLI